MQFLSLFLFFYSNQLFLWSLAIFPPALHWFFGLFGNLLCTDLAKRFFLLYFTHTIETATKFNIHDSNGRLAQLIIPLRKRNWKYLSAKVDAGNPNYFHAVLCNGISIQCTWKRKIITGWSLCSTSTGPNSAQLWSMQMGVVPESLDT